MIVKILQASKFRINNKQFIHLGCLPIRSELAFHLLTVDEQRYCNDFIHVFFCTFQQNPLVHGIRKF